VTACTIEFTDVPITNTFYPFVRCLACQGIISGYPCGGTGEPCNPNNDPYFRPDGHITRGQLSKVVAQSAGFSEPVPATQQSFEDVPYGSPFWEYVERLYTRGIVGGYECGIEPGEPCVPPQNRPYFRPDSGATRGQLTKIVSEAAGFTDVIPPAQQAYADVPPGSTFWVYVERLMLDRPGVMNGYPCGGAGEPCDTENRPYFRPSNPLTRGQASKIVANTFFPGCNPLAR
jgi:S-layer homology domain